MATVATPACFTISLRTCSLWASRLRLFGSARMLQSTTRYAARQMIWARKQNGKAAPWNYYSLFRYRFRDVTLQDAQMPSQSPTMQSKTVALAPIRRE